MAYPRSASASRAVSGERASSNPAPRRFCNIVVTKDEGEIAMDPHVTGTCVLIFNEGEASALRDLLVEWLA
jgi:hypothetical protein